MLTYLPAHLKKAFTLAEVLITLTVIGIVAALTMPALVTKYKKLIAATHLKKSYSDISQAVRLSEIDNGSAKYWEYPQTNYNSDELEVFYNKYLKKYIRTTKVDKRSTVIILYTADGREIDMYTLNNRVEFYVIVPNIQRKTVNGKNMFYFAVNKTTGKLEMDGQGLDRNTLLNHPNYGCNKNAHHYFCTALICNDGWEIKDDYPWDDL